MTMAKKKFIQKVEKIQTKRNIGGNIYRLRLVASREVVTAEQLWYRKKQIATIIKNPKKDVYELWVSER